MKKIFVLAFGAFLLLSCQEEKTAFVNNETLQDNFEALKETTQKFEKKRQQLQAKIQQHRQQWQEKGQEFQEKLKTMSQAQAQKRQDELLQEQQKQQEALRQEDSSLAESMSSAQDSLERVIKKTIKDIAKKRNYTYVFGMNRDFNILYADDGKDITQEVLKALNSED